MGHVHVRRRPTSRSNRARELTTTLCQPGSVYPESTSRRAALRPMAARARRPWAVPSPAGAGGWVAGWAPGRWRRGDRWVGGRGLRRGRGRRHQRADLCGAPARPGSRRRASASVGGSPRASGTLGRGGRPVVPAGRQQGRGVRVRVGGYLRRQWGVGVSRSFFAFLVAGPNSRGVGGSGRAVLPAGSGPRGQRGRATAGGEAVSAESAWAATAVGWVDAVVGGGGLWAGSGRRHSGVVAARSPHVLALGGGWGLPARWGLGRGAWLEHGDVDVVCVVADPVVVLPACCREPDHAVPDDVEDA
jgi:hypothetical protein